MTDHKPRHLCKTEDDRISQLKIELAAKRRSDKKAYLEAEELHEKMMRRELPLSDINIAKHDRAIMIIRKYRRDHYLQWVASGKGEY